MMTNKEHDRRMAMACGIGVLLIFAGWLAFDISREQPIKKQPRLQEWEIQAWRAMKCDHCGGHMDPFNKKDGLYPGPVDGRRKVLCEKCGTEWMAMIERAKKKPRS